MRLILDLCRNVSRRTTYREYFIRGSLEDLRDDPAAFVLIESRAFAYGRVPTPALPEDIYWLGVWERGEDRAIIAVNLSGVSAQGRVHFVVARSPGKRVTALRSPLGRSL